VSTGINKTGNAVGWSKTNGKRHVESTNTTGEDGMEHYSVNVVYVDVRCMCGNGKGFNVAREIDQFIAAARAIDKELCLLPLGGQDNNLLNYSHSRKPPVHPHGRTDKSKRPESHPTKECACACVRFLNTEPNYYYCPITLVMS
jgi:hypothetical protein